MARAEHSDSVTRFITTARTIPDARWNAPRPGDKWSPAQIAEHVRLSYVTVAAELAGGQGLRVRTSFLMRTILRLTYLRRILRSGEVPSGARAPREIRPGPGPFERDATLAGLEAAAVTFEERLATSAPGQMVTHHVFGRFDARLAWRFMTVHTEHHRRQLSSEPSQPGKEQA